MQQSIEKFIKSKSYHLQASRLSYWAYKDETGYDVLHEAVVIAIDTGKSIKHGIKKVRAERSAEQRRLYKRQLETQRHYDRSELFKHAGAYDKGMHAPNFNYKACAFFDKLNRAFDTAGYPQGKHATNGGEVAILPPAESANTAGMYYVDFFIPEYGVVVEYNEHAHYQWSWRVEYDKQRAIDIEQRLGVPVIFVREGNEDVNQIAAMVIRMIEFSAYKKANYPQEALA